ncbi:hypothetical protein [Trueperella abortisuis]|uniref:Uncharacterized protein n=1 Tax=Trueperella abortisuis TaxID=445930 RepID=A0ABT9PH84_9ACTO|nr:hypothetical protein [Trueperella abortisuis]MDP9832078.1 hypothetical protein [Trueperella abortisuis]
MEVDRLKAYERQAESLIELVGTTPLTDELMRQAEFEEAIMLIQDVAEERGIVLPRDLATKPI